MKQINQSIREDEDPILGMGQTEHGLQGDAESESRGWRPSLKTVIALLQQWRRLRLERAELGQLDARERRDIGITRADALRESEKPFWRQ